MVFLLILAVSTLLFHEQVNAWRLAGMAAILAGIWMIAARG